MSAYQFEQFGGGDIGYIDTLTAAEAREAFPDIRNFPKDIETFYVLRNADGTTSSVSDSREEVISNAIKRDLNYMLIN